MAEKMSNVSSEDIAMRSAGKKSNVETLYCFEKNKSPTQSAPHFSDILYIILILGDSEDDMNTAPKDMQSKLVTNPASDTSSPGNEILFLTCTSLPHGRYFKEFLLMKVFFV